jgi:hypothetical protein
MPTNLLIAGMARSYTQAVLMQIGITRQMMLRHKKTHHENLSWCVAGVIVVYFFLARCASIHASRSSGVTLPSLLVSILSKLALIP